MIEHIVLLKLKKGTTESQTQAILDGLKNLSLPGMVSVTGGYNNSPEGKSNGFDWGFTIQFSSLEARDAYLPHPDHKAVSQSFIRPIVDDVLVFDYAH